jgi:hypothetical protein
MREKLIKAGVKNLKEFGYPSVNKKNILTDEIYKRFFISMLKDSMGHGKIVDNEIEKLLNEIGE